MDKSKSSPLLTGITTTGIPHLGNYLGAIKPAVTASRNNNESSLFFLADYHAIIKQKNPEEISKNTLEIAATWLACGLDAEKDIFYRQSDIPEILELNWILSCATAKGLMNRSHAYKAAVQENQISGSKDDDKAISMGLFCYPILMAADILLFNASEIPVGRDQVQHLEMARDIANKMNHIYKTDLTIPQAVLQKNAVLTGLDGRKMSKSYGNTIPIFCTEKKLLKLIKKIKTNSLQPGEPKSTNNCILFELFSAFASKEQLANITNEYASGSSWGDLKMQLFDIINLQLAEAREKYLDFIKQPKLIYEMLHEGSQRARSIARPNLEAIRTKIGITKI
jgi:tryptophanyl-tRNA synthetase